MHWSKWRFSWIPRTGHIMRPKFTVAWKQNNSSNKTLRRSWRQAMVAGKEMVSAWTGQTSVKWMLVTVFAEFWNTEKALVESEEKTQTSSNKESQEEDSKIYQNTASWSLQEALKGVAGIPGNSVSRYEIIQSSLHCRLHQLWLSRPSLDTSISPSSGSTPQYPASLHHNQSDG